MADANGKGNGKANGSSTMRRADLVLADAIMNLCTDLRVEVTRMEGLASVIMHRRVVTTRAFRAEFLDSVRRVGQRHLDMAETVAEKLGEG